MVDLTSSRDRIAMKQGSAESDKTSLGSSKSTLKPGENTKAAATREAAIEESKPQAPKHPIRILIVGPSRSGKTYTIRDCYSGTKEPMICGAYRATKRIEVTRLRYEGQSLELIDTPGFDNTAMSDLEAFTEIGEHLLNSKHTQMGITGMIYVHRAGNTVHSRSLLRNVRVLTNIFLGNTGMDRLAFLVTQPTDQQVDFAKLSDELQARDSVFSAAFSAGAGVAASPNRPGFLAIIRSYLPQSPIMLPIQLDDSYESHLAFVARIEKELGYYEYKAAQSLLDDQEKHLRDLYEQKLSSQREAESQVRQQLQQSQQEYSSLRSQLQLQENMEQSEVVQTLHDLNRMIDDIGRSISAYLADEYVVGIFRKNLEDVTTLDALDLPALKLLVDHVRGVSSLISSHGRGMQIEAFFDYTIRHMLCCYLAQHIFQPFHPGISSSLDQALCTTYESIQKRVPQTSAGKWRSETFKNIHDPEWHHITIEQHIDDHLGKLITSQILPLIESVFGQNTDLKEEHYHRLRSLIQIAWDWNSRLKENVILLGEFIQITYLPHSPFDPTCMAEFEANPRHPQPSRILATLALGLVSQRAMGGGNPVEETVVCKAVVLTKNVFT
ncbi:unnamed protein product [Rhizoctonia solani]|uniref:G domain-containing protein n=1 Tax=Rhizoctonia solani TaxID=456999 RepID=A0A8H3CUV5_9AGAM|nr:unnamed protein product [Rhizoctonia solani]